MDEQQYISSLIFKTGENIKIPVYEWFVAERSKYHFIQVAKTNLGRTLFVNGIVQSAEGDDGVYERYMIRPLRDCDKKILIIGGGDGKLAVTARAMNPSAEITVVDIDEKIVEISQMYFRQNIFSNPKIELIIGDAHKFLRDRASTSSSRFDGVLVDLTDDPVRKDDENFVSFYLKLADLILRNLASDGWVSIQAGTDEVCESFLDYQEELQKIFSPFFELVEKCSAQIPSFEPDKAAFLYCMHPHLRD